MLTVEAVLYSYSMKRRAWVQYGGGAAISIGYMIMSTVVSS